MSKTAVDIRSISYFLHRGCLTEMSKKWERRTRKMGTKWPKEGTFDVSVCEEMETLIKTNKTSGTGKKGKNIKRKRGAKNV